MIRAISSFEEPENPVTNFSFSSLYEDIDLEEF